MSETALLSGESRTKFSSSFAWSQAWLPKLREIIGPLILRPSTLAEDTTEATDLIVLKAEGIRIACRLRKPGYADAFGKQVTITCRRETGSKCEWDKMILGDWGDWFFYGHATALTPDDGHIRPWTLIDLQKMRSAVRGKRWIETGPNRDAAGHRCWFFAFEPQYCFPEAIIAKA
jgi:hypothetical protein